jgi:uncharacterized protein
MKIFFDTSALVKYFHEEDRTTIVTNLILNPKNVIFVSELSKLEFLSALHRRYHRKKNPVAFAAKKCHFAFK